MTDKLGRSSVLALTMGEPAGIGGELTLMAWAANHASGTAFVAIDNVERLQTLAEKLQINVPIRSIEDPADADDAFPDALPVLNVALPHAPSAGSPTSDNAPAVISSIETAVRLALEGHVAGIVTNPIQKHTLYAAGFTRPGHTEFLADLSNSSNPPVMMLACHGLRVVPVTIHVGLRRALDLLSTELIVEQTHLTHQALISDFGIDAPRIAIASLNPHAGESGAMGDEEATIIMPAIEALRANGVNVTGPESPDTLFTENKRKTYDAAICMYHDQALIPIKTLDFSGGVNITLGLPIIRTSPDHGTALDIAGQGIADATSLLAAIDMASELANNRNANR
jgi:4-hydroxythreonine-4-phosphate dehydrogenase